MWKTSTLKKNVHVICFWLDKQILRDQLWTMVQTVCIQLPNECKECLWFVSLGTTVTPVDPQTKRLPKSGAKASIKHKDRVN